MTALTAQLTYYPFTVQLRVDLSGETQPNRQWTLTGATLDGTYTWTVRGGAGFIREGNVVLLDPDVPLEVPVRYSLVTPRGTYRSSTLTIEGPGKGHGVLGTVTGRDMVIFKWVHTLDEQEIKPRFERFQIPGRSRMPVRRDERADEGGGSIIIQTEGLFSELMRQALLLNEPMAIRTHGQMIDWPLVEHINIEAAPSALAEKKLARDWSIDYLFSEFYPLASRMSPAVTVGETAALGLTVGQVAATGFTVGQVAAGALMA